MRLLTIVNLILVGIFLISFSSAQFGYSNPDRPKLTSEISYNILNINNYNYSDSLWTHGSSDVIFLNHSLDKVCIGTGCMINPFYKLTVEGGINFTGSMYADNIFFADMLAKTTTFYGNITAPNICYLDKTQTITGDKTFSNGIYLASTTDASSQAWFRYTNISGVYNFYYSIPQGTNVFDQNVSVTKNVNVSGTISANVIKGNGGQGNKVTCWKSDGKTLGYCSDAPAADGSCTCN